LGILLESNVEKLRERLARVGRLLVEENLTSGTSGNISSRIPNTNLCLIKPSGRKLDELSPEGFVELEIDSLNYSGSVKPSIEAPFHTELYKSNRDIGAVVHVHSEYALILSILGVTPVPMSVEVFKAPLLAKGVAISEFAMPGSRELALSVVKAINGKNACLIPHHGSITVGSTIEEAARYSRVLERICELNYFVKLLGEPVNFPSRLLEQLRKAKDPIER
jgi:L-fuculose-phosphate aldolase